MWKATLKSIRGHKGRVVATALAVILGISFLAGTLIFTASVQRAFDDLFATVFETTDANVRSTETIDAGFGIELRSRIDDDLIETVAAVDGVEAVEGFVQGTATVIGADGEPVGNPGQGPPTFGFSWGEDPELNQFSLVDGRAPTGAGEMALDDTTASSAGLSVGDQVTVLTSVGSNTFELVGVARFGTSGSLGGATSALFELTEAQRVLDADGRLDGISVRAADGISQQEIVDRISTVLPDSTEAITGEAATEESQDAIAAGLSFFTIFLTAFAVIAIFVSIFVIYNTFSILVAQRTREFALFRALGASRDQVLGSVFIEALVIGIVGSLLGIGLGVVLSLGLRAMLDAFGIELPSGGLIVWDDMPRIVIISMILGTVATVVSALFPAIRAARIAPVEAMRESQAETWQRNRTRFLIGLVITALGAVSIIYGLLAPEIQWAGIGAGVMFIGVFVLGPSIARPVSRLLGAPIAQFRGAIGKLARDNSMRNPKRTARTAAALTIGVALVAGVTVLASSLAASIEDTIGEQFTGDFAVDSGAFGPGGGFSPALTAGLQDLPEVETAAGLRVGLGEIEGNGDFISVVDPTVAFELFDIGLIEGSPTTMTDDAIFLLDDRAEEFGVGVGDAITARFLDGVERELTVGGIYTEPALAGNYSVSTGLYESTGAEQLDFATYVKLAEGVTIEEARTAITSVTDAYPNANVQDRAEYIEAQSGSLDQLLGLIYGLLGLAIIIAAFGIANTLRLSTIERTREIGLLRAVGMTRSQVQSTIRWEAVITALFGAALGVVLGLFFGYAIIYALRDQGVSSFNVPGPASWWWSWCWPPSSAWCRRSCRRSGPAASTSWRPSPPTERIDHRSVRPVGHHRPVGRTAFPTLGFCRSRRGWPSMTSMLSEAAEQQDVSSDDFDTMVKAAVDDDQRAVRWLVERYHSDLVDYAGRNGAPDPDGIADLIMARVLARLGGLESLTDEGLETYLFRSLRREMNREIAREQAGRLALVGDPELSLDQLVAPGFEEAFDDAALIESLLDELTDNQRQVVVGRYLRDRTYEELGAELGLTPAAVRKTSSRAIARLRVVLGLVVAGSLVVALVVLNTTARPETVVDTAPVDARPNRVLVVEDPSIDLSENPERSSGRIATGTVPDGQDQADPDQGSADGDRTDRDPIDGPGAADGAGATPSTVVGQDPQVTTTTSGPASTTSPADRATNDGAFWLDLTADPGFWSNDIVFGDAAFSEAIGSTLPSASASR